MRQKWGLIRAVSVAMLFSIICFLNNGSRAIYTLLELRAAGRPQSAHGEQGVKRVDQAKATAAPIDDEDDTIEDDTSDHLKG